MLPNHTLQAGAWNDTPLVARGVSLRQIARTLYGLNSRVTHIAKLRSENTDMLVYTFDVAGQRQSFSIPITAEPVESIADLYPETAVWERDLSDDPTIRFA